MGWKVRDRALLDVLANDFERAAGRAGRGLVCGPGCDACCHGPFPVTRLDVLRLGHGRRELARRDPSRAEALDRRVGDAVDRLRRDFPGDPATGRLSGQTEELDSFFARHGSLACPALDPATGRCELYAWRPVSCRTYGPPLRFGDRDAPHCDLCFRGASDAAIEDCRMEPDRGGLEASLLSDLGVAPGREWETLIAFALVPDP